MRLLHLTVLGALAVPLSVAALARAANFRTCNGRAVLPKYTPYSTVLNTCSIPFGSASADAYFHSIDEYYTQGHTVQHYGYWPSNRCYITQGDGWWDVARVDRSTIGGANGSTWLSYDGCPFSWSSDAINEADGMIANDMVYSNPAEAFVSSSGRGTFLPQFGHAHGLYHNESFDQMRAGAPNVIMGGTGDHIELTGDESWYIHNFWNLVNGVTNLYASSFRLNPGGLAGTFTPTTTVRLCPGQTWPVAFTVGNNGQSNQTFNQRIFVNTSPPNSGYSGGFHSGYWTGGTGNAFRWVT